MRCGKSAPFNLRLVAVLLPILCTLYDSFVVPLVAWYMSGGTLSSLGKTIVGMVTALQGTFLSLLGFGDTADLVMGATEVSCAQPEPMLEPRDAERMLCQSTVEGNSYIGDDIGVRERAIVTEALRKWTEAPMKWSAATTTAAALVIQKEFRCHLARARQGSYIHAYLHTHDSVPLSTHRLRCRVAHQWHDTAYRTAVMIEQGQVTPADPEVSLLSVHDEAHKNTHVQDDTWIDEDKDARNLPPSSYRSRTAVRRAVSRPAPPPPPPFTQELSVLSVCDVERRNKLYESALRI